MLTFIIDHNNHIAALDSTQQGPVNPKAAQFCTAGDLDRLGEELARAPLGGDLERIPRSEAGEEIHQSESRYFADLGGSPKPDRSPRGLRLVPEKANVGKQASRTRKAATAANRGKTGPVLDLLQRRGGSL